MSAQLNDAVAPHKRGIPAWWVTIFLFWLGWIFMYADRTVLNPVMGELEKIWFIRHPARINEFGLLFLLRFITGSGRDPRR